MSFIERFVLLCPLFGVSFIGGSTVYVVPILNKKNGDQAQYILQTCVKKVVRLFAMTALFGCGSGHDVKYV